MLEAGNPNPLDRYILVPSLDLYLARERTFQGKNWQETHRGLQSNGERMPTIPEFIEFLKYVRVMFPKIYEEINEKRMGNPWKGEWLDADFQKRGEDIYIHSYHVLNSDGNLAPQNSEIVDKDTLMSDRTPFPSNNGMSLDDFLETDHTKQGLPSKDVKSGDEYYFHPTGEFKIGTIFDRAGLNCGRGLTPFEGHPSLGVRAVASSTRVRPAS